MTPGRAAGDGRDVGASLRPWAPWIVLLLAAFLAWNRIRLTSGLEYFDPENGDGFFWTEGAVQYRYARMVAEGAPIPERDRALQWPEGIAPGRHLCLLMERTVGGSYRALARLFGRPPFHVWAAFLPHVAAGIGVVAVALAAGAAWGGAGTAALAPAAAVLAAALYAFSLATVGRAIGSFGHEDFALPWLLLAAAFLLRTLRAEGRSRADGPLGALFLALGLASWHFSRFVYLVVVLALGARILAAREEGRVRIAKALAWATAGAVVAGLAFDLLRASRFLLSPVFLLSVALLAAWGIEEGWRRARRAGAARAGPAMLGRPAARGVIARALLAAALLAPLLATSRRLTAAESEGYAHVYALLAAKIRFLGAKPADPARLSPEARSLWIEDFASPSPYLVAATFAVPAALAALALARARRRPPTDPEPLALLVLLVALSGASFLLVKRLFVVLAPFLAALAGGAAGAVLGEARRRTTGRGAPRAPAGLRLAPLALLLLALGVEAYKVATQGRETPLTRGLRALFPRRPEGISIPNWHANDLATIAWVRARTRPDEAFVARIGSSPMILAYAGRPVVLHPKYEVPGIRARARSFDAALYASEEDLYRFCREHRAAYYLHEARSALEWGPDAERYVGCATRLAKRSAAFRLQFAGEESRLFRPLYRNPSYCIYRVVAPEETAAAPAPAALPPQPLYEIARFGGQSLDGEFFDDDATPGVIAETERAIALLVRAQAECAARRYDLALPHLREAAALDPGLAGVNTYLGLAIAMGGDYAGALAYCEREIAVSPDLPLAYANLGFVEGNLGLYAEARDHLERAIALDPRNPGPRAMLDEVVAAEAMMRARGGGRSPERPAREVPPGRPPRPED